MTYTEPAAAQRFDIDVSLDDLGTVSYAAQSHAAYDLDDDLPVVFRLFQPETFTHLYTASSAEAAAARDLGYIEEGVSFSNEGANEALITVHRLFNASTSDYVLTTDVDEVARLSAEGSGFVYEGAAFKGVAVAAPGAAPIHRFYSETNTDHLYTTNLAEGLAAGYTYEGVGWYAVDTTPAPSGPLAGPGPEQQSGWLVLG